MPLSSTSVPEAQPAVPPVPTPPPAAAPQEGAAVATAPTAGIPASTDVDALKARRDELSNQLSSARGRLNDAIKEMRSAPEGAARVAIEQRIQVLGERVNRIESDISANGQALANAPLLNSESQPPQRYGPFSSGQLTAISIVSVVFIWAPLAFAAARVMLRRWAHPRPAPQVLESAARLERMEQAIDAVAIEVERISEGQRFVTQTMAKRESAMALGVGQAPAEPIKVGDAEQLAR
jgi:hypothetical protein